MSWSLNWFCFWWLIWYADNWMQAYGMKYRADTYTVAGKSGFELIEAALE